jgi:hypothetical protein
MVVQGTVKELINQHDTTFFFGVEKTVQSHKSNNKELSLIISDTIGRKKT